MEYVICFLFGSYLVIKLAILALNTATAFLNGYKGNDNL